MKYNYIIYHRGCIDGFSGFFVSHYSGKLTNDVYIYTDVPFTKKIPPNIKNKDILIVDVAYSKNILEEIFKVAKSVLFIDHHISIKDDVIELYKKYKDKSDITIVYDNEYSGGTLAWKQFNPRMKIPLFLKYIEDQDTGRWVFPNTKPFIYALKTLYHLSTENKSLNKWFRLLDKSEVYKLIEVGNNIKKFKDHLVGVELPKYSLEKFPSSKLINYAKEKKMDIFEKDKYYKVAVYCGTKDTELANRALDEINCDFVIMWTLNLDQKKYVISMRSKNVDVSKFTKLFEGGGHTYAASLSFSMSKFRIEDLFEGNSLKKDRKIMY